MRWRRDRYRRAMVTLCAIGRPWGSSTTPSSSPLPFSRRRMPAATSSSPAAVRARVTGISTRGWRSATTGLNHALKLWHHSGPAVAPEHMAPQARCPAAERIACGTGDGDGATGGREQPRMTVCRLAEHRDVCADERGLTEAGFERGKAKSFGFARQQDQVRHAVKLGHSPVVDRMFAVRFRKVTDEDYLILQVEARSQFSKLGGISDVFDRVWAQWSAHDKPEPRILGAQKGGRLDCQLEALAARDADGHQDQRLSPLKAGLSCQLDGLRAQSPEGCRADPVRHYGHLVRWQPHQLHQLALPDPRDRDISHTGLGLAEKGPGPMVSLVGQISGIEPGQIVGP